MRLTNLAVILLLPSEVASFLVSARRNTPLAAAVRLDAVQSEGDGGMSNYDLQMRASMLSPPPSLDVIMDSVGLPPKQSELNAEEVARNGAVVTQEPTNPSSALKSSSVGSSNSRRGGGGVHLNNHAIRAEDEFLEKWSKIDHGKTSPLWSTTKATSSVPGGRAIPNKFVSTTPEEYMREKWQLIDQGQPAPKGLVGRTETIPTTGQAVPHNFVSTTEDYMREKWHLIDQERTPLAPTGSLSYHSPSGRAVPHNFVPTPEDYMREKWQLIDQERTQLAPTGPARGVSDDTSSGRAIPHNFLPTPEDYMLEKWQKIDDGTPKRTTLKQQVVRPQSWSGRAI